MSDRQDIKNTSTYPGSAEASRLGPDFSKRFNPAQIRDALADAIHSIVLPRLLEQRRTAARTAARAEIARKDVAALLDCVAASDPGPAKALVEALKLRRASREAVLLDLFAPVAERLGDCWQHDEMTFADVMLGVGRLSALIQSDVMPAPPAPIPGLRGAILVASMPGDQHTFGATIIEDILRSAGWDVLTWSGSDAGSLVRSAMAAPVDIIGISVSDAASLPALRSLAGRLKLATGNRLAGIARSKAAPGSLGVDSVLRDARKAVATVRGLLKR
jgi:MerR family transcriptional regulator, light-induced transcriptional regulator